MIYHREMTFTENGFQFGAQRMESLFCGHGASGFAIVGHLLSDCSRCLVQHCFIIEVCQHFIIQDDSQLENKKKAC